MPCVGLQCVIVVFPDHIHFLFVMENIIVDGCDRSFQLKVIIYPFCINIAIGIEALG